jgi:hypothetical protein
MEEEYTCLGSLEGYRWWDEEFDAILASSLASFEGVDHSQEFSTETFSESLDSSPSKTLELDLFELISEGPLPDLDPPLERWQDHYTPFTDFTTPNSSNMTWTPSSGGVIPSLGNLSISSELHPLSPEQPTLTWTPLPFGELQDVMLFDQIIQQTDPVQDDPTIAPDIITNAPGLPPEASALTSTPLQQRRRSGTPARERRKKEKPTECPVCDKGFPYKSDMDRHILTNHPERALEFGVSTVRPACLICGRTFSRKDHKTRHDRRVHKVLKPIRVSRKRG